MWESQRDFQRMWEGWKAGFLAFHTFHILSFPWPPLEYVFKERSYRKSRLSGTPSPCVRPALNQPVLVDLSDFRYSVRNTRIGSVRIARIAGIYMAISETAASRIAEIPNKVESKRWSGSGELASNRLSSNKAGSDRQFR